MSSRKIPDHVEAEIRNRLSYNKDTGVFNWNFIEEKTPVDKMLNSSYGGRPAGRLNDKGYIIIKLQGYTLLAHRIAWFLVKGKWPDGDIDHINRNRSDNRYCNLRDVDRQANCRNSSMAKSNTSGFTGVSFHKGRKKWVAHIKIDGVSKHLGTFETKTEAIQARLEAEEEYGFHETHGKL